MHNRSLDQRLFLLVTVSFLNCSSVFASVDSLNSQRERMLEKIQSGQATDAEVEQFIQDTLKVRAEEKAQFHATAVQSNQTNAQLQRVERQNKRINDVLFGGVSAQSNSHTFNDLGPSTQITPTSEAFKLRSPIPNVIGGLEVPLTPELDRISENIVDSTAEGRVCNDALSHYSTPFSQWWAKTKDMINYSMPYRANAPSSMAADVILNEKLKLNSLQSCLFAKRKLLDETRLNLTQTLLQAAATNDFTPLEVLASKAESDHLRYVLSTHLNDQIVGDDLSNFAEKSRRYGNLVKTALEHDKVINDVADSLHKFNKPKSKAVGVTLHVVEPILGAAAYVPNLVGPIAHGVLCGLVYVTGGPETDKILKELFLDKCLESRSHLMCEQGRMSLDAYQQAVQQNNPMLFYCAKTLINEML